MYKSQELLEEFIKTIGDKKLWPPLNNYSLFVFGSEYNTSRYSWDEIYGEKIRYDVLNISDGDKAVVYLPEQALRTLAENVFSKYLKDKSVLSKFESEFYKNFPTVDEMYAEYTYAKVAEVDFEQLGEKVIESFDLIMSSNVWSHFSIAFDKELCLKGLKEAGYPISEKELEEIWDVAITPRSRSFDKDQEVQVLAAIAGGRNLEDMVEECQYFYATYKDVQRRNETEKKLVEQYGAITKEEAASRLKHVNDEYEAKTKDYQDWLSSLSEAKKDIAVYIQSVIKIRDNRKNFFAKMFVVSWRIAERMFEVAGISPNYILNILPLSELSQGPEYLKRIKEEILARSNGYVAYIPSEGGVKIAYDNPAEIKAKISDIYTKLEDQKDLSVLRGQVGCRGVIKGRARIILEIGGAGDFKQGEILVTGMTRPEFVPLMRMASAIVTDEGGVTCHAAIVSRELGKPCVIGTKIATRTLKTGDLVEVDANRGVVTIVEAFNK